MRDLFNCTVFTSSYLTVTVRCLLLCTVSFLECFHWDWTQQWHSGLENPKTMSWKTLRCLWCCWVERLLSLFTIIEPTEPVSGSDRSARLMKATPLFNPADLRFSHLVVGVAPPHLITACQRQIRLWHLKNTSQITFPVFDINQWSGVITFWKHTDSNRATLSSNHKAPPKKNCVSALLVVEIPLKILTRLNHQAQPLFH